MIDEKWLHLGCLAVILETAECGLLDDLARYIDSNLIDQFHDAVDHLKADCENARLKN
jgi:hypothetical protein